MNANETAYSTMVASAQNIVVLLSFDFCRSNNEAVRPEQQADALAREPVASCRLQKLPESNLKERVNCECNYPEHFRPPCFDFWPRYMRPSSSAHIAEFLDKVAHPKERNTASLIDFEYLLHYFCKQLQSP